MAVFAFNIRLSDVNSKGGGRIRPLIAGVIAVTALNEIAMFLSGYPFTSTPLREALPL